MRIELTKEEVKEVAMSGLKEKYGAIVPDGYGFSIDISYAGSATIDFYPVEDSTAKEPVTATGGERL